MDIDRIRNTAARLEPAMVNFLTELIRIPSSSGDEARAMTWLAETFGALGLNVEKVYLDERIRDDPDYSSPMPELRYDGRFNLRISRKKKYSDAEQPAGSLKNSSPAILAPPMLLLNAHVDTVPPSRGMLEPYSGRVQDGTVFGRGACDDKGPLAVIYTLYRLLDELEIPLEHDVVAHLVVEEELGGNGTLAMIRKGEVADFCVVLEPTAHIVLTSIRGALWFKVNLTGKPGHSAQAGGTSSALDLAQEAMRRLRNFQQSLLAESRGIPLFDAFENPMPLTIGRLHAGDWPSSVPYQAVFEGVIGFLPNRTRDRMEADIRKLLSGDGLSADNCEVSFTYRHDCSVLDPEHQDVQRLLDANHALGLPSEVLAMPASCDAWFYRNQLGIPTVVCGPGQLRLAHGNEESIRVADITASVSALAGYLVGRINKAV